MFTGLSAIPQRRLRCAVSVCAVVVWMLGGIGVKSVEAQCQYEVSAIIEGPSCGIFGHANLDLLGMNDLGQACGVRFGCAGGAGEWPWVWSEETGLVTLPFPEGAVSGRAVDINNVLGSDGLGQVACTIVMQISETDFSSRAFLYDDGKWTRQEQIPGSFSSDSAAINDSTVVVGDSHGNETLAVKWEPMFLQPLDLPMGPPHEARDVNADGSIVGWMRQADTSIEYGFWHADGVTVEIPPLRGGDTVFANAVNAGDVVVGETFLVVKSGFVPRRAWRYEKGQLYEFPNPDSANRTRAIDVNDAGQILIVTTDPSSSFLWQNEQLSRVVDITVPYPKLFLGGSFVKAINSHGQIGGVAGLDSIVGAILTPVDRPLGDVNIDCAVDMHDLITVLEDWGPCPDLGSCLGDIVTSSNFQPPGDGKVDGADLAVVLGNWSPAGLNRDS